MLLLDTQVVLWVLDGNARRLGLAARDRIAQATAVHVSAATVWELTIKSMLGKLTVPAGLPGLLKEQGFELLTITAEDAEAIRGFPEIGRHDPFDRVLVAQADRAGLTLLTADRILLALGHDFIVDAAA
jgi:PIN domain nuclease of toxin-antitoxin system